MISFLHFLSEEDFKHPDAGQGIYIDIDIEDVSGQIMLIWEHTEENVAIGLSVTNYSFEAFCVIHKQIKQIMQKYRSPSEVSNMLENEFNFINETPYQ